jgi:prolyl-tRNA synthetase
MNATFTDENGNEVPFFMGCYGIGITRTVAASIEQNSDKDGIIWPPSIAPYHVIVTPIAVKDQAIMSAAERLYAQLQERNLEVLLDDRDERPGVKFKDADLIGIPLRVTVGSRGLQCGTLEIRVRRTGETHDAPIEQAADRIVELLREVH